MARTELQQYVLLPSRGTRATGEMSSALQRSFLTAHMVGLHAVRSEGRQRGQQPKFRTLDSIHEDGAKLIESSAEGMMALRAAQPGMRVVPVVYFEPAIARRPSVASRPTARAAAVSTRMTLTVVSSLDGSPLAGAHVVAFTDFAGRVGAQ